MENDVKVSKLAPLQPLIRTQVKGSHGAISLAADKAACVGQVARDDHRERG